VLKLFSESVQSAAQSGSFLAITKMSKEIAVQHTGYTADRMMIVETEFEYDNGMAEYKVKFRVDGSKYEIKITPKAPICLKRKSAAEIINRSFSAAFWQRSFSASSRSFS